MGSNYAPTIHVQQEASRKGLQQVLWLYGEDHQVTEVGTMNIFLFFVNDKGGNFSVLQQYLTHQLINLCLWCVERELRTPALSGLILPGITRDSILQLTKHWGKFKVVEGPFTMPDVVQLAREERVRNPSAIIS